ncbi:MAG TPA: OmpA family protein [Nevskiaceae bacterium]|nr:OmpA family protein [Nevskiaceae bacterium]
MTSRILISTLLVAALPLGGCMLASNAIDYSSYPIPALPAPPPPPPPVATPCEAGPGETISLAGCATGDTLVLHGVTFEFNKATLTPDARTLLDQVITALKSREDIKVEIAGHTDGIGSDAYNQKLSEARASSVKKYLADGGIADARMTAKGFGKTQPIADNSTEAGRDLNRRVELRVVESAPPPPAAAAPAPAPAIDHTAIVVLEPIPSFLQEPGTGIPTSIGVLTIVPTPKESGPDEVTSKRALPANYNGNHPAMKGYPGSAYSPTSAAPVAPPAASSVPPPAAAAATTTSSSVAPAAAGSVSIANFAFAPSEIVVAPASVVTWLNRDNVIHTIKFKDHEQKLKPGESYSAAFSDRGEYPFQCGIHPSMTGKVIVQ